MLCCAVWTPQGTVMLCYAVWTQAQILHCNKLGANRPVSQYNISDPSPALPHWQRRRKSYRGTGSCLQFLSPLAIQHQPHCDVMCKVFKRQEWYQLQSVSICRCYVRHSLIAFKTHTFLLLPFGPGHTVFPFATYIRKTTIVPAFVSGCETWSLILRI
jgi:hypothetical protein